MHFEDGGCHSRLLLEVSGRDHFVANPRNRVKRQRKFKISFCSISLFYNDIPFLWRIIGNFEDSYKLIDSCMRLLQWLLNITHKCLLKIADDFQVPEYSTVVGTCVKCLEAMQASEAILALLHLSTVDDPGTVIYPPV